MGCGASGADNPEQPIPASATPVQERQSPALGNK